MPLAPLVRTCLPLLLAIAAGCGKTDTYGPAQWNQPRPRPATATELKGEVATIVDALYGEEAAGRAYAAQRLGQLGPAAVDAVPFLVDALDDPNREVRAQAAEALGALGDREAVEPLIARIADRDGDWSARAAAARALGRLGDRRAVEPLVSVLNDMNAHVRHMAVISLGQIGDAAARDALQAAAKADSDAAIRFAAIQALQGLEMPEELSE